MAQNIAIERVDHIGVRVRNLDRALGFYRVLGFAVVRRAEGDDVAIIRNEHGVELNLVFNANAGDPATNILMDVGDKLVRALFHWLHGSRVKVNSRSPASSRLSATALHLSRHLQRNARRRCSISAGEAA